MAPAIDMRVVFILDLSIAPWRDDGDGATLVQILSQSVDVKCFVGQQRGELDILNERRGADAIMAPTRQQNEPRQVSQAIHQGDELGGQRAFGAPDGLISSPPFAPLARARSMAVTVRPS